MRDVAFAEALQFRRAGGVIADDCAEQPFVHAAPQRFAIGVFADRRRALECRRAIGNRLGFEVEIVRRRLRGERHAGVARAAKNLQAAG